MKKLEIKIYPGGSLIAEAHRKGCYTMAEGEKSMKFCVKNLTRLAFLGLVLGLTGCGNEVNRTVTAQIRSNPELQTFSQAIETANLKALLDEPTAKYTIFAPNDAAFATNGNLPTGEGLEQLLVYHIVNGDLSGAALKDGSLKDLETVQGSTITITVTNNGVVLNNLARVTKPDIKVGNSIIHIIDKVLTIPPATQ